MIEKRREPRNACYLQASIIVSPQAKPVPAEAHDISEHGLRLRLADAVGLPDEFIVSIPRRKMREVVCVIRRGKTELGVVIKAPHPLS